MNSNEKIMPDRILILDNDILFLKAISHMLKKLFPNSKIKALRRSSYAISEFGRNSIDLFIVDMRLPENKSAINVIKELKKKGHIFKSIGISSYPETDEYNAGKGGIDIFLSKPFFIEEIENILPKLMSELRTERTSSK